MTDLFFPHSHSVNNSISPSLCSLHYCELDEAVHIVLNLGRGARMKKVDLKSAYRVIPIHPDDTPLLGVKWNSNVLLDKALPFGLRSAPKIFSAFANALAWVALQLGVDTQIHYLDDFFHCWSTGQSFMRSVIPPVPWVLSDFGDSSGDWQASTTSNHTRIPRYWGGLSQLTATPATWKTLPHSNTDK